MPVDEPTASMLARYSVALGARGVRRGPRREAAWRVWMPLDVDRVAELPWVASRIVRARPRRVLDIASPKLLACWLADRCRVEQVVATDLWPDEVDSWRRLTAAASGPRRRYDGLRLEVADATRLPYEDASFDALYSASVLEHIADDGDIAAAAEIARVLRPGAIAALTVPYGREHREEHVEHDLYGRRYDGRPLFFQRHYDAGTIDGRLLAGGALEVVERGMWRKEGIQEARGALRRVVPESWEIGRFLGPGLLVLGGRAMRDAPVDEPGEENVLRLLLRRR
ncbi:MAG: methyltransferase domain-containing protein [Solirubrobacteraceae bacterium]